MKVCVKVVCSRLAWSLAFLTLHVKVKIVIEASLLLNAATWSESWRSKFHALTWHQLAFRSTLQLPTFRRFWWPWGTFSACCGFFSPSNSPQHPTSWGRSGSPSRLAECLAISHVTNQLNLWHVQQWIAWPTDRWRAFLPVCKSPLSLMKLALHARSATAFRETHSFQQQVEIKGNPAWCSEWVNPSGKLQA